MKNLIGMTTAQVVKVRSRFGGWNEITKEEAYKSAKDRFYAITTRISNKEKLQIVNSYFAGIEFSIEETYE